MQILKLAIAQIRVPEHRQRTEVDGEALGQLMESISQHGLLHPIVVRASKEGWPDPTAVYTLVAGGRRLAAISNLSGLGSEFRCGETTFAEGYAPCITLGSLDALAAEEAELEENIRRVDLSWQDHVRATARLDSLRRRKAEGMGRLPPTLADLALEVRGNNNGAAAEDTRRELILASQLGNPEVSSAKNLTEAWKAHTRAEQVLRNQELAAQVGATFGAHSHTLVQADSLEWIRACPPGLFDVVLTDPPYGMGADEFGDAGGRLASQTHGYADTAQGWQDLIGAFGSHWYRVAKERAHLYVCCDIDGFHYARDWLRRVGWWVHRTPLIIYKLDGNRVPWPEHGPQRKYELILYAVKGKRNVTRIYPDVIETKGDPNLAHGAQKPVALFKNLLVRSVAPGDTVLDCFAGTGTTLVAAHELKCKATCIEVDSNYYGIALKRLQELK